VEEGASMSPYINTPPRGWWPCYFILFQLILFHVSLFNFHNAHQVLVGLPQGAGGLAILFCLV
jgi:hypothetical protein